MLTTLLSSSPQLTCGSVIPLKTGLKAYHLFLTSNSGCEVDLLQYTTANRDRSLMSGNTMPPSPKALTEDPQPLTWLLQSFAFGKDQKTTGPTNLFLDRANAEFGFIRYSAHNVAAILRFPDTDEPMYFQAEDVRAAAWREKCKKVCVLFQHLQLDLEFASPDLARSFLDMLGDIMMAAGIQFYAYEVPPKVAFMKADFDMEQQGFTSRATQPWIAVQNESSEWPRLRKTGEWSDFTIFAGGSQFPVHRVKICKESNYFKVVCSGGFRETAQQSVVLPEPARIVSTLLDEMYGVYNPTTGSIFTSFAPRKEIEKEHMLNQLLDLFVAADKVCHAIFFLFWPHY
jgi:histone acetyltransferase HTATIP